MDKHVAVIGAGASGIVAAKTLLEHGYTPVVFEKGREIGGVRGGQPAATAVRVWRGGGERGVWWRRKWW
jgi:cation diffusion facilitator CzcD-associated flavoprotein CzcO